MNAPALHIGGAVDRCAICGAQRQFHGRGGNQCASFVDLPSASAWHRTSRARRIVADMRMLAALAEAVNCAHADDVLLRNCGDAIGVLERRVRLGRPTRYEADGIVGDMLYALDTLRTDAIDAARLSIYPESYSRHDDAYDDLVETLEAHFDTVAQAVDAVR